MADSSPCDNLILPRSEGEILRRLLRGNIYPMLQSCSLVTARPLFLVCPRYVLLCPCYTYYQLHLRHSNSVTTRAWPVTSLVLMWLTPLNGLNCPFFATAVPLLHPTDYCFILDPEARKSHPPLNWGLWARIRTWKPRHFGQPYFYIVKYLQNACFLPFFSQGKQALSGDWGLAQQTHFQSDYTKLGFRITCRSFSSLALLSWPHWVYRLLFWTTFQSKLCS